MLAPTLAHTPQSGDGAEIVTAALRGGVLHPTGFPLQAWLDRALAQMPDLPVALAISALGLVAHAAAAGLVAETLRTIGVGPAGRLWGAAAFALLPSLWAVAVVPEVFSLAHLLLATLLFVAVRWSLTPPAPSARLAAGLGALGAAAAAQHPIALAGVPALLIAAARVCGSSAGRVWRGALAIAVLAAGVAAAYASLPLLRTSSPWPDWGHLRSAGDVARHALRLDYGAFSLAAAREEATRSALVLWVRELATWWNVALALALAGLVTLGRRRELRPALWPIAGTLLGGIAILWRGRLPAQSYSDAYLEKLQGPATLGCALLLGIGAQWLRDRLGHRGRPGFDVALGIFVLAWLGLEWPRADASADRTLDLYARGIALELPRDAVYVTEGEVEAFLGAPVPRGPRFPVSQPLASLPWYAREVAPRLEPRVLGGDATVTVEDWDGFMAACFDRRLAVASTSRAMVATPFGAPELRGLLYVARPGAVEELTTETIAAAAALAPLTEQLPTLGGEGHEFSRFYVRRFARAYAGAAEALRRRGRGTLAATAESVAVVLESGGDLATRSRLLRALVAGSRTPAAP